MAEQNGVAAENLWREVVEELTPSEAKRPRRLVPRETATGRTLPVRKLSRRKSFIFFRDPAAVARKVSMGIPVQALDLAVLNGVIHRNEIGLVLPERTYRGRRQKNEPLSVDESDKFARMLQIMQLATETFGSTAKAHKWLRQPKRRFDNNTPISMLRTSHGAQAVEDMLVQIAHGIAA